MSKQEEARPLTERERISKMLVGTDQFSGLLDTEVESLHHQKKDQLIGSDYRRNLEIRIEQTLKIKAKIKEWLK